MPETKNGREHTFPLGPLAQSVLPHLKNNPYYLDITSVSPGRVMLTMATASRNLRPGGVISGPTLMSMSDTAAYALVLAHVGEVPMAVTTSLTIHFLRPCKPGVLYAEADLLRLGRRIATCDVSLWTEGRDRLAAKATVAYALPEPAAA